ncbi:MAG: plasmid maintenance protein CcdB [Nitrospirales bacterium]|nr:MAG: plasmid maintenance protein CcdB [Nitrospirales bacterium]
MARFDVYTFSGRSIPLVIDVQAELLSDFKTRVVVPLILESKAQQEVLARLKPVFEVNGKRYVMITTDIGTIRTNDLGSLVGTLKNHRHDITAALDFLFQGF